MGQMESKVKAGPQGPAGQDGVNGSDGAAGVDGADGQNGIDGQDGTNGIDGLNSLIDLVNEPPEIIANKEDYESILVWMIIEMESFKLKKSMIFLSSANLPME